MSCCKQPQVGLCVGQGWKGSMPDKWLLKWIVPVSLVLVWSSLLHAVLTPLLGPTQEQFLQSVNKIQYPPKDDPPLPLCFETWILTPGYARVNDDDLQWWSSVLFGCSSGKVSCLVCGGTLGLVAGKMTFAMGLSGFFWDSRCSRDRSLQPTTLSACICHSVLFTLPVPRGESELSCFTSLLWLQESAS